MDGDGYLNPLDRDSDGDGLEDQLEDKNRNGIVDPGETDPTNPDSDGDQLSDGQEDSNLNGIRDENETAPDLCDSDADGIPDGSEPDWDLDTDGDGLINALDPDSDDDGLTDGDEASIGTGPLNPDTDQDGVSDGTEIAENLNPLNPDTDEDWLLDGKEAVGAYWCEIEALAPADLILTDENASGKKSILLKGGTRFSVKPFGPVRAGPYKLYIRARDARFFVPPENKHEPELFVNISGGDENLTDVHPMPYCFKLTKIGAPPFVVLSEVSRNIYRWYSTSKFRVAENYDIGVELRCPDNYSILVDRIMLTPWDSINVPLTDPLCPDTDGDGLSDGYERKVDSYWWEAEDFAYQAAQVKGYKDASNGKEVSPLLVENRYIYFEIPDNFVYHTGPYSLYVRARGKEVAPKIVELKATITVEYENFKGTILGTARVHNHYRRGRWEVVCYDENRTACGFWLENRAKLKIELWQDNDEPPLLIDKVALINTDLRRPWVHKILEGWDPLPRCLDPMDPDTDGDQWRSENGSVEGSEGYLTDGFEWDLGLNPFDLDTDLDVVMNWGGRQSGPDDNDPNPFSYDLDMDGLFDWIEDRNENLKWEHWENYKAPLPEFLGELNFQDADTDDDGILDGNEFWNFGVFSHPSPWLPDSDGDMIIDGIEEGLIKPQRIHTPQSKTGGTPVYKQIKPYETLGFYPFDKGWTMWTWEKIGKHENIMENENIWWRSPRYNSCHPDTDHDGLPDGWIDFNNNQRFDEGEFEDVNLDGIQDHGEWMGARSGCEGSGETSAIFKNTDGDRLSDYEEEVLEGTNPLVYDRPDLCIVGHELDPEEPVVPKGHDNVVVIIKFTVKNFGKNYLYAHTRTGHPINLAIDLEARGRLKGQTWSVFGEVREQVSLAPSETRQMSAVLALQAGTYDLIAEVYYGVLLRRFWKWPDENAANDNLALPSAFRVRAYPTASFENLGSTVIEPEENVPLRSGGSDPDGSIVKYEVDWEGDGILDDNIEPGERYEHTYENAGKYLPTLRVTDNDNLTDERSINVVVRDEDDDGDGLVNRVEKKLGSKLGHTDSDSDGLTDLQEFMLMKRFGLSPWDQPDTDMNGSPNINDLDSDGDGVSDGHEITADPSCKWESAVTFEIGDWFFTMKSSPYSKDTDSDGVDDASDLAPRFPDEDGDGMLDGEEEIYNFWTSNPDTDEDGVRDGKDISPRFKGPSHDRYYEPGEIRFNKSIHVYSFKGEVWKKSLWEWEEISSSRVTNPSTEDAVTGWDWGKYWINSIPDSQYSKFETIQAEAGTWPNYRIKYTPGDWCYENVQFANWEKVSWRDAGGYRKFGISLENVIQGKRQSLILQFPTKRVLPSSEFYRFLMLTYQIYSGSKPPWEGGEPIYENSGIAVKVDEYRGVRAMVAELPIPSGLTSAHEDLYIRTYPIWFENSRGSIKTRTWDGEAMSGLVYRVFLDSQKELRISSRNKRIQVHWPLEGGKTRRVVTTKLEWDGENYLSRDVVLEKRFWFNTDTTYTSLTHVVENEKKSTDFDVVKQELNENRYGKLVDEFEKATCKVPFENFAHATLAISGGQACLGYAYDTQDVDQVFFTALAYEGVFFDAKIAGPLIFGSVKTLKAANAAAVAATCAVGAVNVAIYAHQAWVAEDDHVRLYWMVKTGWQVAETAAEVALEIALPGVGTVIVIVWESVKLIPQVQAAIESAQRAVTSEIEAIQGKVPAEFAVQMYNRAVDKIKSKAQSMQDHLPPDQIIICVVR